MIHKKLGILLLSFFLATPLVHAGEWVTFKGTGKSDFLLKGILIKPEGPGPFPAVVMLPGAAGFEGMGKKSLENWAKRFADWGYVSLLVDSFGPRGESDVSNKPDVRQFVIGAKVRAQDACDAKRYLNGLSFVRQNQVALVGWSHGGWSVLRALDDLTHFDNRGEPFQAAVAFYPYCDMALGNSNAPLLILAGELDDWTRPAKMCRSRMPSDKPRHETVLKIYPEATHCFDFEGIDTVTKAGNRLLYNPIAAGDATEQVKAFLSKHLR